MTQPTTEATNEVQARKRKSTRKEKPNQEAYRKVTIMMPAKLDMKLSVYAKVLNVNRSAAAREILEEKIGGLAVRLAGVFPGEDEAAA